MYDTPIELDRDNFMRQLITSLGHLNEGILGSDIAGGYIMNVGLSMGAAIEAQYRAYWELDRPFTVDEYAHVIVDLKQRIKGNFRLISAAPDRVVVHTTSCPFDKYVQRSPSLCFMTSSVFGGIAARNFGYAKVVLHRRIALGDPGCEVTVFLKPGGDAAREVGREYYPEEDRASTDIREQLRHMEQIRSLREALDESSGRWAELIGSAPDAICVLDPDQIVTLANPRWRTLLGFEGEELVGGSLVPILPEEGQKEFGAMMREVLTGRRRPGIEIQLRHRDGAFRDVIVSAAPLRRTSGQITGAVLIAHDVTAARSAERLKDSFLSSASHELRTPVTTIRALTDLLLRRIERDGTVDPATLSERLMTIRQEADRLALLGVDLFDSSRLRSGSLTLQTAPIELNHLVRMAMERLETRRELGALARITTDLDPEAGLVDVELNRILQLVDTLLDNALNYSTVDQPVTIRTERDEEQVRLTIEDQGIGIPAADLPQIFTPFFRGSNVPRKAARGLGLSLYLGHGVAEAHGGELTVISTEGDGATFSLRLPATDESR